MMMEALKEYLETSTIHGLLHIARSERYFKLFWGFVVITGFSSAGLLINENFRDWDEHPISTALETLGISEMTFPNITVCPPRNQFTSLNYDISLIDQGVIILDDQIREETIQYVRHGVYNSFDENLKQMSSLFNHEFYELWYRGNISMEDKKYHKKEVCHSF